VMRGFVFCYPIASAHWIHPTRHCSSCHETSWDCMGFHLAHWIHWQHSLLIIPYTITTHTPNNNYYYNTHPISTPIAHQPSQWIQPLLSTRQPAAPLHLQYRPNHPPDQHQHRYQIRITRPITGYSSSEQDPTPVTRHGLGLSGRKLLGILGNTTIL
jgi:hypothetical protein